MAPVSPEMVSEVETDNIYENSNWKESIDVDSEEEVHGDENINEEVSDLESDNNDPWDNLHVEVKEALNSSYDKQAKRFLGKSVSEEVALAKTHNVLLPVYRKRLRRMYLHHLKWFCHLKRDPVHQEVMKRP